MDMCKKKSFILGSAAVIVEMLRQTQKRKRNARRMWVRDIYLKRKEQGFYDNLIAELRIVVLNSFLILHA